MAARRSWFRRVFGFPEPQDYDKTRQYFRVQEAPNGEITLETNHPRLKQQEQFFVGRFETPSLQDLNERIAALDAAQTSSDNRKITLLGSLKFSHIADDAAELHTDADNHGCLIQAASQFNCLEMVSPAVTPRDGISGYALDYTQGPACALACPAGTLYRNYFWNGTGQGGLEQINTLADLEDLLASYYQEQHQQQSGNITTLRPNYWTMKNGYALPTSAGSLRQLRTDVFQDPRFDRAAAMGACRTGVHWETEVVDCDPQHHRVGQVYASAMPLGYDRHRCSIADWEPLARLVLDAAYESTLAAAVILARQRQRRVKVFLTKLGGGVFANPDEWITAAIVNALAKFRKEPLDVFLVHYQSIDSTYVGLIDEHRREFSDR